MTSTTVESAKSPSSRAVYAVFCLFGGVITFALIRFVQTSPYFSYATDARFVGESGSMFPQMAAVVWCFAGVFAAGLGVTTFAEQGFTFRPWRLDLLVIIFACIIILPVGMVVYSLIRTNIMGIPFRVGWDLYLPVVWYHFAYAALPEEIFFRGFLQTNLGRAFGGKFPDLYARLAAVVIVAAVFAYAHVFVQDMPIYWLAFLPGLVFGLMREFTGSLTSAIAFHTICNVVFESTFGPQI
ncbi:type II CAAX prenyl endopeptidase Rce1 family protein [Candidatus Hydrogenedentota bacterium]